MLRPLLVLPLLLAFVFTCCTAAQAAPNKLFYHRAANSTASYRIQMHAEIPTQGVRDVVVTIAETITTAEGDGFHAKAVMDSRGQNVPSGHGEGTYRVGGEGDVSELAGTVSSPAVDLRNLALLYMPLPGGAVDVGATWTGVRTMYTPDLNVPVQMPPLKMNIACKLLAFENVGGHLVAKLDVKATTLPGQQATGQMSGSLRYDQTDGRVVSCAIGGAFKMKVLFTTVTVPFSLNIVPGDSYAD
jgi:hypothetical protein